MNSTDKIKQLLGEVEEGKYFLYRKGDVTGFGNKLRGIHIAFLTSLLTGRKFICNYHYLNSYFSCPEGVNWDPTQIEGKQLTHRLLDPLHREQELHELCTQDLNVYLNEDVIVHQQGNTWIHDFISNPHHLEKLNWLFDNDLSIKNMMGTIMSFLLSEPKKELTDAVEDIKVRIGWDETTPKLGFQYRSNYLDDPNYFVDTTRGMRDEFPKIMDNFIEIAKKWYPDNKFQVYLTTDESWYTKNIAKSLSSRFDVIYAEQPIVHTQIETPSVNPSVVEWFLLGDCDNLFSTFTSYSLLAASRTNHKQKHLYKHDQRYVGDLVDDEYKVSI